MEKTKPQVLMYGTRFCPFCLRARLLLKSKDVEYDEIYVDGSWDLREEMIQKSGRHTVPQIFIGDHHIGGFDDMKALNRAGELDSLLGLEHRT